MRNLLAGPMRAQGRSVSRAGGFVERSAPPVSPRQVAGDHTVTGHPTKASCSDLQLVADRQAAYAFASRGEDRVTQRGGERWQSWFADTAGRHVPVGWYDMCPHVERRIVDPRHDKPVEV